MYACTVQFTHNSGSIMIYVNVTPVRNRPTYIYLPQLSLPFTVLAAMWLLGCHFWEKISLLVVSSKGRGKHCIIWLHVVAMDIYHTINIFALVLAIVVMAMAAMAAMAAIVVLP